MSKLSHSHQPTMDELDRRREVGRERTEPPDGRLELATAYGLLWLVTGDSKTDQNIRLAFAARPRVRAFLTLDELKDGIVRAKELAKELNVVLETWM